MNNLKILHFCNVLNALNPLTCVLVHHTLCVCKFCAKNLNHVTCGLQNPACRQSTGVKMRVMAKMGKNTG